MARSREFERYARDGALVLGGAAAILLQVADPVVARGVGQHSAFADDPMRRLRHTLGYVYSVLKRLGAPGEHLEDLCHDVFMTAFRKRADYDRLWRRTFQILANNAKVPRLDRIGVTVAQTCAMSLLVFTGASQFAAVGVVAAGGSPLAFSSWLRSARTAGPLMPGRSSVTGVVAGRHSRMQSPYQ